MRRAIAIAGRVRAGTFGVNQGYSMDPAAPFGGVKGSGYGRELGPEGIESYLAPSSRSPSPRSSRARDRAAPARSTRVPGTPRARPLSC
ncbi:hypothetical protein Franean1_2966 [Parafrankia sp. EAN1pec]|nr:hypothetical protein Franean1_2966 [Frankia sp. EAN1pec]